MNYRHAFHAGNFADVLKHVALTAVLLHLKRKDTPFAVVDTHAGRGLYDLSGAEAEKTREADAGIRRLIAENDLPGILSPYVALVREFGGNAYPGSPLIAAKLLRDKDRLAAIEAQDAEFDGLRAALRPYARARAIHGDGYRELKRLLPPPERRGLTLIDPPYEAADEFKEATHAVVAAHRRFATGIVLIWYPAKERPAIAAAAGELMNAGIASLLRVELDAGVPPGPAAADRAPPLTATGLLVVNPPYGFADEMRIAVAFLAERLAQGPGANGIVDVLAAR